MSELRDDGCDKLWRRLVEAETAFYWARHTLFSSCRNKLVELTKEALDDPHQRVTALGIVKLLTVEERQVLLPDVLPLACTIHGQTEFARELVLGLPRQWLIDHIEQAAAPLLGFDDYEEYSGVFQIYLELDTKLARSLAERAAGHSNPDIREAGEHFFEALKDRV
jgi:hypothetical protein